MGKNIRIIKYDDIVSNVYNMILKASFVLPSDLYCSIKNSINKEESSIGKSILSKIIENAEIAENERKPICQDTGTAVFFVEIGDNVVVDGGFIKDAIFEATKKAYEDGYLRKSIVKDPLYERVNTKTNLPPIIHFDYVKGDRIKIYFSAKGGGAENMSMLKMLKPLENEDSIVKLVVDTVFNAGGNQCPPVVIGVGIGGNFEYCAIMAKRALLKEVGKRNSNENYARLEERLIDEINKTGLGPQGLGGRITCLDVHIEYFPCHIASLPVAVNLNCHANRHTEIEI